MAITFEQKRDISTSLIAAVIIAVLLAVIGFFVWKVYWQAPVEVETLDAGQVQLEYRVLNDDRIISMELFPGIPPVSEASVGKDNPFAVSDASTTEEIEGAEEEQVKEPSRR